ncbi:MAG: hypothetical protein HYV75_10995 [Opitutae bacterium]|nr:hypothetical protein [Opitutae bacterium]
MNPTSTPSIATPRPGGRALLAAWLVCGVLDINAAFLNSYLQTGRSPLWVLQAVASALLGKASFEGGAWASGLGLAMHFFVAFNAAAVFWLLSRKFPLLLRHAVPAGLVHGAAVYGFMNGVTIPFCSWFRSLYLHTPVVWTHAKFAGPQFGIHLTCVGLAIALAVKHFSRPA